MLSDLIKFNLNFNSFFYRFLGGQDNFLLHREVMQHVSKVQTVKCPLKIVIYWTVTVPIATVLF